MRLALVHAARAGFDAGAPAIADPDPSPDSVSREDCLLVLLGVEPEDPPRPHATEWIRTAAAELRCDDVLLVPCPALVDAAADRGRTDAVLDALADALADAAFDTLTAPTAYHLELDVCTKGHPEAVRVFRPGERHYSTDGFDATALVDAELASATEAGLRWTPSGTVARRALLGGVAARFAAAGAEPVDPPVLPDREGTPASAPDALRLADPPVLLRPRATFGADPDGPVYATGPAVEGADAVYRPEALAPATEGSFERWLRLTADALAALGFDPSPELIAGDAGDAALARRALGDAALTKDADSTDARDAPDAPDAADVRVEFHTTADGPTGVVERTNSQIRCASIGTARRALSALMPSLPVGVAPTQLRFVPLAGSVERCRSLADAVLARADVDDRHRPTSARLSDAASVPFVAVVSGRDDAIPIAGPDGQETRVAPDAIDAHLRTAASEWDWPPVRARRPVSLSDRTASEQS